MAFLEGRGEEHVGAVVDLRGAVSELRLDLRGAVSEMRSEIRDLRAHVDAKITALDTKLDAKTDSLDAKITRHFTWLVGIQVAVLVAIVGALVSR